MKDDRFQDCTAEEQRIVETMPTFTEFELTQANDLFKHYLFYRTEKGGRRFWTSCCHKEGIFVPKHKEVMTKEELAVSMGAHNEKADCPFCGRAATIKCSGKIGRGAAINEQKAVVFLRNRGKALFAQAYTLQKCYNANAGQEELLAQAPYFAFEAAYRFMDGEALQITKGYEKYYFAYEKEKLYSKKNIREPFMNAWGFGPRYDNYHVVGKQALGMTFAKYCQYEAWRRKYWGNIYGHIKHTHHALISYMTAYAIYPRQIEMLVKLGLTLPVSELVIRRKKNAKVLNWAETDPRKAFQLSGQELKVALEQENNTKLLRALEYRHDLMRAGERVTLAQIIDPPEDWNTAKLLDGIASTNDYQRLFKMCKERGVKPSRLCRYLEKFTGPRCRGAYCDISQAWILWRDTMDMAEILNFDALNHAVSFPLDLDRKHSDYIDILNQQKRFIEANENIAQKLKMEKRKMTLKKRYEFRLGDLIICVPEAAEEITKEGKDLEHCVGGFAYRHQTGEVTILFLRKAASPNTSFLTIEMSGNTMRQIHGYKNEGVNTKEGRFAPDPREVHKEFLDTWLGWLKAGSKRDESGQPILRKAAAKDTMSA